MVYGNRNGAKMTLGNDSPIRLMDPRLSIIVVSFFWSSIESVRG